VLGPKQDIHSFPIAKYQWTAFKSDTKHAYRSSKEEQHSITR